MKTFEKVRLWIYLPVMLFGVMNGLYYTLTAPAGMGFLRGVATVLGLLPFGVFALNYHPRQKTYSRFLPLAAAGVHLITDVIFLFCARVERPFGIGAWSYFGSLEYLMCMVCIIAALLLLSRKSFAVGMGVAATMLLMTFNEAGAFRIAGFLFQLSFFVLLILFAWDALPEEDSLIRFFGWLFEKDAEMENDTPVTERMGWPEWKYGALDEDELYDDPFEEEEDGDQGDY